jgi:hypothetical protein
VIDTTKRIIHLGKTFLPDMFSSVNNLKHQVQAGLRGELTDASGSSAALNETFKEIIFSSSLPFL